MSHSGQSTHELDIFHKIQEKLLLKEFPYIVPGISIDGFRIDPRRFEGFFIDIIHPASHLVDVIIGYVHQPGLPALTLAAALKLTLLRYAQPKNQPYQFDKIHLWEKGILTIQQIMQSFQDDWNTFLMDVDCPVSIFYGRFNLDYNILNYINCGQWNPYYYNSSRKECKILHEKDKPFGIVTQPVFQIMQLPIQVGDLFAFCLDEINQDKEEKSADKTYLINLLLNHSHLDVAELHHIIFENYQDPSSHLPISSPLIFLKAHAHSIHSPYRYAKAKFASNLSQLEVVRNFVRRICRQTPGDGERLSLQMQLILNEAFCNIVKHSYHNNPRGEIRIEGELQQEGIFFTISDQGEPFNPSTVNYPNLSGDQEDGFGLFIIQQIADQISYKPKSSNLNPNEWNHFRIFKRYILEEAQMEFTHQIQDDVLVVTPQGESLDAKNAPAFKEAVLELIRQIGTSQVVFDLHHLQFIDSSGLGIFLSIQRTLTVQGGKLKLVRLNKPIRTMFEIVSMHRIFDIFNTVEEAIKSF